MVLNGTHYIKENHGAHCNHPDDHVQPDRRHLQLAPRQPNLVPQASKHPSHGAYAFWRKAYMVYSGEMLH